MREALKQSFFQNSLNDYLVALAICVVGFVLVLSIKRIIFIRIKKLTSRTNTNFDDFVVSGAERFLIPALYYFSFYVGVHYLTLTPKIEHTFSIVTTVVITYLFIRLLSSTLLLLLQTYVRRQERGEEKVKQLGGLMIIINILIWVLGLVFLFNNMGYNVTAVITGLGIGGIAIALAAQNILGDLFNYFVIFFDRPFEIGDFIIIDDKMGAVDYIGIKTTRIKSLTGEQLIFSNSDLTNSRIHNYKRMEKRRIVFKIDVVYQTDAQVLKSIPPLLKKIIEEQNDTVFDRAHFASFGASSLVFEIVYFVLSSDYNKYMDIQQNINLRIFAAFNDLGVEFAYPTQSLFIVQQDNENKKSDIGEPRRSVVMNSRNGG